MTRKFKKLLFIAFVSIIAFSTSSLPTFAAKNSANDDKISQGECGCDKKDEVKSEDVTGTAREDYLEKALNNDRVKKAIDLSEKDGYVVEKDDILVKRIYPEDGLPQVNVVITVSKAKDIYRTILYNDSGVSKIFDINGDHVNMDYTLPGEMTTKVMCLACSAVCVGLIEAPPAFASCVALCAVACGA